MTRHLHIDRPVGKRHPQVLYPDQLGARVDLVDLLAAEWAQKEAEAHRKLELGYIGRLFRFGAKAISGDCFFLITGAMVALDLCLIVWLSQR